ncbi:MAG TPA: copper-binding protein [Caldimonas sp.]|nr:copper-binding protein [Caldimonas sp.]
MKVFPFLLALAASSMAQAQMSSDMRMPMPAKATASATSSSTVLTEGEVQSVDAGKGVVTLKHGDIVNMQMPAMTMAFGVAGKKMLSQIKAGDKVRFHVEMLKSAPTVTHIEPSR